MKKVIPILAILSMHADGAEEANRWKKPDGEPLFVAVSQKDEQMALAFQKAKASFPDFLAATKAPKFMKAVSAVKIRIRDEKHSVKMGEDRFTYLWVYDVAKDGESITAVVRELPKQGLNDLKVGLPLRFPTSSIYDWMLILESKAWGAYTIQVVRDRLSEREQAQYDQYSGITSYTDEIP